MITSFTPCFFGVTYEGLEQAQRVTTPITTVGRIIVLELPMRFGITSDKILPASPMSRGRFGVTYEGLKLIVYGDYVFHASFARFWSYL